MACIAGRTCIWILWVTTTLITGTYAALSLVTFSNIYNTYDDEEDDDIAKELRAVLAASFFGSVMVFAFAVFAFLIILGKTIFRTGAGFSYGFITSSAIHMAITSLLCGLVLHGFENNVENFEDVNKKNWEEIDTSCFKATFYLAYIATFIYLIFFFTLTFCKGAVSKQLTAKEEEKKEMNPKPERKNLGTAEEI